MRRRATVLLPFVFIAALSCGGDSPTDSGDEPDGPGTGSISAQVDGQAWSATTRSATLVNGTLTINGTDALPRTLHIGIANVTAPGTFQLTLGNPNGAIASVIEGAAIWSSSLSMNAAQAIPEGNTQDNEIRVTTDLDSNGRVVVRIADTGPGIPAEFHARIFAPYFTTKPPGIGTGLGLPICLKIIARYGGHISFDTAPGEGTTFHVTLPASAGAEPEQAKSEATESATRRGRILVIDDNPLIGRVVQRALSNAHDVTAVESGREALRLLRETMPAFDLVFCDLMMPDMSGIDLYESLRDDGADVLSRIVFLTGGAFTQRSRAFLASIDNRQVDKPVDIEELRRIASHFVAQRCGHGRVLPASVADAAEIET